MNLQTKHNIGDIVYVIKYTRHTQLNKCDVCQGKGKVEIKSKLYTCPECFGQGQMRKLETPRWEIAVKGEIENIHFSYTAQGFHETTSESYLIGVRDVYSGMGYTTWTDSKNCFNSYEEAKKKCKYNNDHLIKGLTRNGEGYDNILGTCCGAKHLLA